VRQQWKPVIIHDQNIPGYQREIRDFDSGVTDDPGTMD
jgi:hypothetical protein